MRFDNPAPALPVEGASAARGCGEAPQAAGWVRSRIARMSEPKPTTITKKELVNRIAEETGHTKVVVKDVIQRFLDAIVGELSGGNRLEFREFGVFEIRERAARMAQNPKTLDRVKVPPKRTVKFKIGRLMKSEPKRPPRPPPPSDMPPLDSPLPPPPLNPS